MWQSDGDWQEDRDKDSCCFYIFRLCLSAHFLLRFQHDAATSMERSLENAWHGAEAYHLWLLAHRELYAGHFDQAMKVWDMPSHLTSANLCQACSQHLGWGGLLHVQDFIIIICEKPPTSCILWSIQQKATIFFSLVAFFFSPVNPLSRKLLHWSCIWSKTHMPSVDYMTWVPLGTLYSPAGASTVAKDLRRV